MDQFAFFEKPTWEKEGEHAPLAARMRPRSLDEVVGQEKLLAEGRPLRRWIERDDLPSLIFWGPPGCGKTTLARLISQVTEMRFEALSAVLSGVKDIKEAVERARYAKPERTILFVDEIHRFNKSQQDALLPHVENGTVILIGATTENPSFELNSALLSRVRVLRLERIDEDALVKALTRACEDTERGLGGKFPVTPDALRYIARLSEGDARRALTLLDSLYLSLIGQHREVGVQEIREELERSTGRPPIPYDKSGEEHYNVISAFIKSIRDSDPHAGLYYLARMIEGGEDPVFIARRLVILASEDVGNADPRALQLAIATKDAVELVGMPEGRIPLAQAVTYLAVAPKSNAAYVGIAEALECVKETGSLPVPMHLRNAPTQLMKAEGYGSGYQYAHEQTGARVKQKHLPEQLNGKKFYRPKEIGLEKQIKEKLDQLNSYFE